MALFLTSYWYIVTTNTIILYMQELNNILGTRFIAASGHYLLDVSVLVVLYHVLLAGSIMAALCQAKKEAPE